MQPTWTRECTEVFLEAPDYDDKVEFAKRALHRINYFPQRIFASQDRFDDEEVKAALTHLLYPPQEKMAEEPEKITSPAPLPRKDIINRKRKFIQRVVKNQAVRNISQIARFTKTSKEMVKNVLSEMEQFGEISLYEYNNLHDREDEEALVRTIEGIQDSFLTVAEIKRKHPKFSRKMILRFLHDSGYRYRMIPKKRLKPNKNKPNSTRICRVISHIAQAVTDPNTIMLYCDEMKFPLYQTADKKWARFDTEMQDLPVYNRRYEDTKLQLTAIALCSLEKFEAVQIFKGEVTGPDFLYFLNQTISRMDPSKNYSILVDNASWHKADIISKAKASDFLFFNEARMFQLNIIENAFSFVRHAFRIREHLFTMEEEANTIARIFFDKQNVNRFKGLFRNHLRMLLEQLKKHRSD